MQKIYVRRIGKFCFIIKLMMLVVVILSSYLSYSQVAGDFRTTGSGIWSTNSTWQRYNGSQWDNSGTGSNNPGQVPSSTSSVFIQSGHIATLSGNGACNDLHISHGISKGNKTSGIIGLSSYTLELSGKIRDYYAPVNTVPGTSDPDYNIYPFTSTTGKVSIVGNTRNLSDIGEWSANITTPASGLFPLEINLNSGQTVTLATGIKISSLVVNSGTLDAGTNIVSPDNGGGGNCTINTNGIFMSANTSGTNSVMSSTTNTGSGSAGNFILSGTLSLSGASPQIQFTTVTINTGSTVILNGTSQSFLSSSFTGAASIPAYGNLTLSNSGNKNATGNFTVLNDLTISGSSVLLLTTLTATIGGNWTSYGSGGFTEGSSTVNFNGTGAQSINTSGGEDFFKVTKTGIGTLTQNSDVRFGSTSSELSISAGIFDAGTFSLSGTASTALVMSGGTLRLGKLATTLPEFPVTTGYSLTGGTIELNGAGSQTLRGARDYRNLTFSTSGTKDVTSAPTTITGTITVANTAVLDVASSTMGGTGTNLIMTGTSRYITAGTSTKPDGFGTYNLGSTSTIEFSNNAGGQQDIRLSVSYGNIDISGSNVGLSGTSSSLNMQTGTTFKVSATGTFNVQNTIGFTGSTTTAINNSNTPIISLIAGGTINYDGANQLITNTTPYQNLTLSGSGIKTAPSGTLDIFGNLKRSGTHTFAAGTGRVTFAGSALQTYTAAVGAQAIDFYNVSNTNIIGLQLDATIGILNELNIAPNAKLNLNMGDINMRSTATRTSYITDLGTTVASTNITYGATGLFNIERYLQSVKSWRLLATPMQSSTVSITNSWREGISGVTNTTSTGYGTQVTGPPSSIGMDQTTQRGSVKWFDASIQNYKEITNTSDVIARSQGYYVFVRGDRAQNLAGAGSATNLRIRGKILTGDQTFTTPLQVLPTGNDGFATIGNPYPSQINFKTVNKTNIDPSFTIWNPTGGVYGVGRFIQYFSSTGLSGNYSNGGITVNTIESGQAFFLQSAIGVAGSITIKETDKATGSNLVSRNGLGNRQGVNVPTLEITLQDATGNAAPTYLDQAIVNFDDAYSNGFDGNDLRKFMNASDNIAIKNGTRNLILEKRATISATDTIFLSLTNTRVANYSFEIDPSVLSNLPLNTFLVDKFLVTETPLSLSAVTNVSFSITSDAASRVADRFMIVFKQAAAGPLPVSFTTIAAEKNADKTNTVKWNTANEINVSNYDIERSANTVNFTSIGSTAATGNNGNSAAYHFVDAARLAVINYYRVKAISANGQIQYSAIVKVVDKDIKPQFAVQPNPVINKKLNINLENMQGNYSMRLVSKQGATVFTKQLTVSSISEVKNIEVAGIAAGLYDVLIVDAKGKQLLQTVFIQ